MTFATWRTDSLVIGLGWHGLSLSMGLGVCGMSTRYEYLDHKGSTTTMQQVKRTEYQQHTVYSSSVNNMYQANSDHISTSPTHRQKTWKLPN
ncbi:hypothetical protein ASPWEDRAFT_36781 [Aspergillus wentii DTO 134E9]|uniref:Uncharacterized protein n=1 Tax=Aspergillus wentii DTO 134E9 TaxID=1073089 RepID=A0A1L9RVW3_ASPWE|nr:uncharacterized protein ASPWEDRAFT_36781 [Aspergillus wentii DTO 134E9]OJJ39062.1 hypothetical protein ASPWEDRAFT_36781 [Aspergillus wentii DTO 134E9]